MNKFVNMAILANPVNWLFIFAVLVLVSYSGFTLWTAATGQGTTPLDK